MTAKVTIFDRMIVFLNRLDEANIRYTMRHSRDDAVMVNINVPGERWEVEYLADGDIEVEVFRSNGDIREESAVEELFSHLEEDESSDDSTEPIESKKTSVTRPEGVERPSLALGL